MKDLGVKVKNGIALDANKGLTIKGLQKDGFECIFLGIGLKKQQSLPLM